MSGATNFHPYRAYQALLKSATAPAVMPKKKPCAERKNPEQDFQISLVRDLRRILSPEVFLTAFPAGGGGERRGKFLKATGLVSGVPDLLLIYKGHAYWLELKAPGRGRSTAQIVTAELLDDAGSPTWIARSLDEALNALEVWNIPTRLSAQGTR